MNKLDYKKEYKNLYMPSTDPIIIEVPEITYIMVDGKGDPNDPNGQYQQALEILYGLSFTIKMSKMKQKQPEGYFEYVVPPLEGLWWKEDEVFDGMNNIDKTRFHWISMIRQPEFVTNEVFLWAKQELQQKRPELDLTKVKLQTIKEGTCAQLMHIGPYDEEPKSIKILNQFIENQNYQLDISNQRKHHEIYLSDPRRTKPENLKTVIRHPIKPRK